MKNQLINYKFLLAHHASKWPKMYTGISRLMSSRDECYTSEKTEIVIDGFPRCANTYATTAFQLAQKQKAPILAHHIHKQSQFLIAENYKIPAILLIREPVGCISSLLIRQPRYDAGTALKGYYLLYKGLVRRDQYVVGAFETVLNHYASVIESLNKKFGTNFQVYEKTEENEEQVKKIVQTQDELIGAKDYAQRVAYPTEERKRKAAELVSLLNKSEYSTLLGKCREVYNRIIEKQ
jgi:hypothetical protein